MMHFFFPTSGTILYNAVAYSVIEARPRRIAEQAWTQELFYRRETASEFVQVATSEERAVLLDPKTTTDAPLLLFQAWKRSEDEMGGYVWLGLHSLDLISGEMRIVFDSRTLPMPAEAVGGWIQILVGVDAKAERVVCSIGMDKRAGPDTFYTEYWLCEIDVVGRAVRPITLLNRA